MNRLGHIISGQFTDRPIGPAGAVTMDLLRGLSALLVLGQHLRVLTFPGFSGGGVGTRLFYFATSLGHSAVIVFFVLSGFLVGGRTIVAIQTKRWTVRRYAVQRIGRIATVLIPALAVGLVLDLIGLVSFGGTSVYGSGIAGHPMLDFTLGDHLTPTVLAGNILGLQPFLVPSFGSNSALWSLGYEVWFYVLFPILILVLRGGMTRRRSFAGLAFAAVMLGLMGPWGLAYFAIWALGASLVAWPQSDRLRGRRGVAGVAVLAAAGLVVAALLAGKIAGYADLADMVLLPVAVALLVHAVGHLPRGPAIGPLHARLAQGARSLADMSFSLYLVHLPLLTLMQAGLTRAGLLPLRLDPRGFGLYAALSALTLLYAAGFASLTERRTDDIRAWISRRRMATS